MYNHILEKVIEVADKKMQVSSNRSKISFKYDDRTIYEGVPFQDVLFFKDVVIEEDRVQLICLVNQTKQSDNNRITVTKAIETLKYMDFSLFDFGEDN